MDTQDLALPKQDVWLKKRGTQWKLRIPAGVGGRNIGDSICGGGGQGVDQVHRDLDGQYIVEIVQVVSVRENRSLEEFSIVINKMEDDGWSSLFSWFSQSQPQDSSTHPPPPESKYQWRTLECAPPAPGCWRGPTQRR